MTDDPVPAAKAEPAPAKDVRFGAFLGYFLWLGTFGFGGPIATVGYMQRDLVEQRRWLAKQDLLDGIALGQTMPGPLAAQVAMWVGFLRKGVVGALGTALAFVMPSFLFVTALGFFYVQYQGLPFVRSLFYGIAPVVIAIIVLAAVKLAQLTDGSDLRLWAISAIVMVVTAATESEVALLFIGGGLVMLLWEAPPGWLRQRSPALLIGFPVSGIVLTGASAGTLVALFLFFLKAGAFIFGSGLAIVPFLREGVITQYHWLTERQFFDAVAVGLITPGPVVITATFIGYLVGGFLGAIVATIGIFTPIYLGVVIPGRWFVRHRNHPRVRGFVKGATAAAVGGIAGATIVLGRQAITDLTTTFIALAGLLLLWRLKSRMKEPVAVLAAGAAGLALHGF